jgi:4-amino-4-deoxy-L-arabinose transferase-like glycosyltransferase
MAAPDRQPYAPPFLLGLLLGAFALRVTTLDRLGLAYDEAATALMARATPREIIAFHWDAAFEHPPVWVLLMHFWSNLAGQSEFALRWLPALAGTLLVPLVWYLARYLWPDRPWHAYLAATFVAIAPVLLYYSQEARMYTLVVALMFATLRPLLRLYRRPQHLPPDWPALVAYWALCWAMLGLHYYAALGIALQAAAIVLVALLSRTAKAPWAMLAAAFIGAALPLAFWMAFSPGFQTTVEVVLKAAGDTPLTWQFFLSDLWRELTFGSIRWLPPSAMWGLWLAPLVLLGAVVSVTGQAPDKSRLLGRWVVLLLATVPIISAVVALRVLSPRYILWVVPALYLLAALATVYLARLHRAAGVAAAALVLAVCMLGLTHYFGPYRKSEYRDMVRTVEQAGDPQHEAIILEAPRQHLLAKYYLPDRWPLYPMPTYPLPAFWPVTAPALVPDQEDDVIQAWLRRYQGLWAFYAGENEVDQGEFLAKYLTAVAYRIDCRQWLDVRVCHYLSPHHWPVTPLPMPPIDYAGEVQLTDVQAALYPNPTDAHTLLVQLDWRASATPTQDYKVTLRLVDAGATVVSQTDDYPIGPLLPPTAWRAGDHKPGYVGLALPETLAPGLYTLQLGLYTPDTLAPILASAPDNRAADTLVTLAQLEVGDTIALLPAP